eukprot:TRINITY_DN58738_c0_g1_i1.p1 TRINITY_DN58738_c0_g1~~TRINITY_DN58738_c0_g1_i1.p1  ORF type:complete len:654 (-),score=86.08 TRINITY_DN58738_c0_g1_i1:176-2137(-)
MAVSSLLFLCGSQVIKETQRSPLLHQQPLQSNERRPSTGMPFAESFAACSAVALSAALVARRWRGRRACSRLVSFASMPSSGGGNEENPVQSAIGFMSGLLASLMAMFDNREESQHGRTTADRSGSIVQQMGRSPIDVQQGLPIYSLGAFPECTDASDLRRSGRHFTVVTTAALPWSTGPAINPLLRALYLAKQGHPVVLLMPWIKKEDQDILFTGPERFDSCTEQEKHIFSWCRERAGINANKVPLTLLWYEAGYVESVRSIFPVGDISNDLGDTPRDVLVLEEPEHLCWYHNGQRWTELFSHVIGVVHTNYQVYLEGMGYDGLMGSASFRDNLFSTFTSTVCSAYCDVTIKLSSAGISLPNEVQCNVHGVRQEFFDIARRAGRKRGNAADAQGRSEVYFIGKAVMAKGWMQLIKLLSKVPASDLREIRIDGYGSGPDSEAIAQGVSTLNQDHGSAGPLTQLYPGVDHADKCFENYKVLVNPSTTEMLCTVTMEALAMGKRVVIPDHPSNRFFKTNFPDRCSFFVPGDAVSFADALHAALACDGPQALPAESQRVLSWDAALERLCDAAQVRVLSGRLSRPSEAPSSRLAYELHMGIQRDTPALSDLLKNTTLKTPFSWEASLSEWLQASSSSQLLERVRKFMRLQKQDVIS